MTPHPTRTLLGKSRVLGSRAEIYQVADALEIDASEQYDIVQRRVLLDDVQLVTLHREIGPLYLAGTGALTLLFMGLAILILSVDIDAWPAAIVFGLFGTPPLILFLLRLLIGIDVVTIFGRRSKANIRFALRKRRAREVYGLVCAAVRSAHRRSEIEQRSAGVAERGMDEIAEPAEPIG